MDVIKKQHYSEIDIAKGIGILLVVIGHAVPDANTGILNYFWGGVFRWIYSFPMALFMTMSGVLFYDKAIKCITREQKLAEIHKRATRLLIPYSFFSFTILAIKIVFSSLSRRPISGRDLWGIVFGKSPCGNMWFLWTLFVISTIVLIFPKKRFFPMSVVGVAFIIYFFQDLKFHQFNFGLNKICNMLIWFSLGMLMGKNIDWIKAKYRSNTLVKVLASICLFTLHLIFLKYGYIIEMPYIEKFILATLGISLMVIVSFLVAETNSKASRILQYFGKNSMCIYVFSYFIQTPGVTIYRKVGSCGIPYNVWVMGLAVFALLFAEVLTRFVRKKSVLKLLFLGEKNGTEV